MGNSNSTPPTHDGKLPNDILMLSDFELKCLWHHAPLTVEQTKEASRAFVTSPRRMKGFFQENERDQLSGEAKLAIRLNELLPGLAQLRFRLVPTKMKEDVFWQATLSLLKERLVDYNAKYGHEPDDEAQEESPEKGDSTLETPTTPNSSNHSIPKNGEIPTEREFVQQLNAKTLQIRKLKKQIKELQAKLEETTNANSNDTTKTEKGESAPNQNHHKKNAGHTGKWNISHDSQEFLDYPEEVKQNLRNEKQKRLQQVHDEMKFILDSDDIQDTHGKWDCCGQTKYHAECSQHTKDKKKTNASNGGGGGGWFF
jgi:hypothetical protein